MGFERLNAENWDRKELWDFYEDYDLPYIIMTADINAAKALELAHDNGVSFNLVMVWASNKAADSIVNFRYRVNDGNPLLLDHNRPVINHLFPGTEHFVAVDGVWPCDDPVLFCRETHSKLENIGGASFVDSVQGQFDIINYSSIPWVRYTHMLRTIKGGRDTNPKITFGKYEKKDDGSVLLPLSVQVHHALMDGQHVGQFYGKIQQIVNDLG